MFFSTPDVDMDEPNHRKDRRSGFLISSVARGTFGLERRCCSIVIRGVPQRQPHYG